MKEKMSFKLTYKKGHVLVSYHVFQKLQNTFRTRHSIKLSLFYLALNDCSLLELDMQFHDMVFQ